MKKAMIICIICVLLSSMILIGCSSSPSLLYDSSISLAETVPTTIPNIDGYEFAVHEKFNSAAKENGLANTKIYTEGTIIQITTKEKQVYGRLKADDGNWTVIFGAEDIVDIEELRNLYLTKNVKVFGTYLGLSSVTTYPVIFLEKVQHGDETLMYNQLTDYAQISQEDSTKTKETNEKSTESTGKLFEELIFNNNGVMVTYTGISENHDRINVNLRIENNSGHDYIFQVRDVSVNSYMITPIFSCNVKDGKIANDELIFRQSDFDKNGIKEIKNIELSIHAFNWDDNSNDFDSEMISFNP